MYLDSKVDTLLSVMKGQEKSCAFVAYYWSENVCLNKKVLLKMV